MTAAPLRFVFAVLAVSGCASPQPPENDDGWRPFRAGSPVFSPGAAIGRDTPAASRLTVPRLLGTASPSAPLREEEGNVWPDPEPPRTTLTDPDAVARGTPNFQPLGLPVQIAPQRPPREPSADKSGSRVGAVVPRPEGRPAVTGAGTEDVWTYTVPGRPGVGTALPDGRGGRILLEPGGATVIAPR